MPTKKTALRSERGVAVVDSQAGTPLLIALIDLDEDPTQPRQEFDDDLQQELVASITAGGIKQPLLVHLQETGRYMVMDGTRRKRAAEAAGLREVPAVLRTPANWLSIKEDQLVTNRMRQDLTVLETAQTLEILWLGHQIAALEAETGHEGRDTAAIVAEAGTPARQIEALRTRLCDLSGFPSREAYLGSGKHVRVSWARVLQIVGLTQMTPDRRKKILGVLDLSVEAQDALAGAHVSERTLQKLAGRSMDEQRAIVGQAQGQHDVGGAIRNALDIPGAEEMGPGPRDWEPEAAAQGGTASDCTAHRMSTDDGFGEDAEDLHGGSLPLNSDANLRSTFDPDPTLAMPFSKGPGTKLVADRGEIGRGSVPPAGHDQWTEDQALKLSSLVEAMLNLLDETGPAYIIDPHKGWLLLMWQEAIGRLEAAGLEARPA